MKEANTTAPGILISPMGEGIPATFWQRVAVVHRQSSGKVSQWWLSACASQRALTTGLMEQIIEPSNLMRAYRKVVSNGGNAGIDGMAVKELKGWLREHYSQLKDQLLSGSYYPQAVRKAEIPKSDGGKRMLGIPTVIDRLVQQAIAQVLTPHYEAIFSEHSYGFRPKRSAHQALQTAT
jgi:RNA-directed DNA polymerase